MSSASAGPSQGERLVYEIVVTAAGTRSQGWRGTLFDGNGKPIELTAGATIDTHIGTFVSTPCPHLWSTCGMIHSEMLQWMETHNANTIMGSVPWTYRLFVLSEGTKSEGWQGELHHGTDEVVWQGEPVATPMGAFKWHGRANMWDRGGWYHESWPEARAFPF